MSDVGTTVIGDTIVIPAHAPAPVNSLNAPLEPAVFTAEQIAAARKQEKDKLYPEIENQKAQIAALTAQMEQFNAAAEEARRTAELQVQEAENARKAREEAELSAHDLILRKEDEWNVKFTTLQTEADQRIAAIENERLQALAILAKDQELQALTSYKQRRIAEVGDDLAPIFVDVITGNTEDEIERSISTFVAKSSAIIEANQQTAPPPKLQRVQGVPTTGAPSSGTLEDQSSQQTYTLEQIKNMPMDTYMLIRDQLKDAIRPR